MKARRISHVRWTLKSLGRVLWKKEYKPMGVGWSHKDENGDCKSYGNK